MKGWAAHSIAGGTGSAGPAFFTSISRSPSSIYNPDYANQNWPQTPPLPDAPLRGPPSSSRVASGKVLGTEFIHVSGQTTVPTRKGVCVIKNIQEEARQLGVGTSC